MLSCYVTSTFTLYELSHSSQIYCYILLARVMRTILQLPKSAYRKQRDKLPADNASLFSVSSAQKVGHFSISRTIKGKK